jgi:hypothetical protein
MAVAKDAASFAEARPWDLEWGDAQASATLVVQARASTSSVTEVARMVLELMMGLSRARRAAWEVVWIMIRPSFA